MAGGPAPICARTTNAPPAAHASASSAVSERSDSPTVIVGNTRGCTELLLLNREKSGNAEGAGRCASLASSARSVSPLNVTTFCHLCVAGLFPATERVSNASDISALFEWVWVCKRHAARACGGKRGAPKRLPRLARGFLSDDTLTPCEIFALIVASSIAASCAEP